MTQRQKLTELEKLLRGYRRLAIAFSGGVDSAFLLKAAVSALGSDNVLAITARAINFPDRECGEAVSFAQALGIRQLFVDFDIMGLPEFAENGPERCYHCKHALFSRLLAVAAENGLDVLADGANVDDVGDYRPGMRAAEELGIASPLRLAGMSKQDIRLLSRELGIEDWHKPSFACLASRIPYGQPITRDALERVDKAEQYFFKRGFNNIRVRSHGPIARIEVNPEDRARFFDVAFLDEIGDAMKKIGFTYAAFDVLGYRSGSMNEEL